MSFLNHNTARISPSQPIRNDLRPSYGSVSYKQLLKDIDRKRDKQNGPKSAIQSDHDLLFPNRR
jgi:hypothetical protein